MKSAHAAVAKEWFGRWRGNGARCAKRQRAQRRIRLENVHGNHLHVSPLEILVQLALLAIFDDSFMFKARKVGCVVVAVFLRVRKAEVVAGAHLE
jgi:hypothetical protein